MSHFSTSACWLPGLQSNAIWMDIVVICIPFVYCYLWPSINQWYEHSSSLFPWQSSASYLLLHHLSWTHVEVRMYEEVWVVIMPQLVTSACFSIVLPPVASSSLMLSGSFLKRSALQFAPLLWHSRNNKQYKVMLFSTVWLFVHDPRIQLLPLCLPLWWNRVTQIAGYFWNYCLIANHVHIIKAY